MPRKSTRVSCGIACCRKKRVLEFLLVQKKNSYAFANFVFGKYSDDKSIIDLFDNMTVDEKFIILSFNFDQIWYELLSDRKSRTCFDLRDCASINQTLHAVKQNNDFYSRKKKIFYDTFTETKLRRLLTNRKSIERRWEFPKGRHEKDETYIQCANREFQEETGLSNKDYKVHDLKFITSSHDSNNTTYISNYIIATAQKDISHLFNCSSAREISGIAWMSFNQIASLKQPRLLKIAKKVQSCVQSKL